VIDPLAPVLVGGGQVTRRVDNPADALEPLALMAEAALSAERDAEARGSLLLAADTVAVVNVLSWRYANPAAQLARRLGCTPARTVLTSVGGNSGQLIVNELAADIARGNVRVALIAGAEAMYSRQKARREPRVHLDWTPADAEADAADGEPESIGDDRPGTNDYEQVHAAAMPTQVYPIFETALRAAAGRSVHDHQVHIGELWSTFAHVAAENPHAWTPTPWSPDEIRTVSPDNRMVVFPYTKRMCANLTIDQGAAVLLCSYEAAQAAGVPDDRMVFLHAGADGHDHYFFTERWSLAESPAIARMGRDVLAAAGIGIDDVARFDLYSCFPSAVQMAMAALGLRGRDTRPLTVTGGLPFAGGPGNNYVTHSIAAMIDECRRDPGSFGVVTGLGWYVTKHSAGVYSTTPPAAGYRRADPKVTQAAIDALPRRVAAGAYDGPATVEASSIPFDRDGNPSLGIIALLAPDGRRVLANTREPAVLKSMCEEEWADRTVAVRSDGTMNTIEV
jgi:acetyl-CoA C-acetyltransferase